MFSSQPRDTRLGLNKMNDTATTPAHVSLPVPPNGWRVSGERRAESDERVRCTRVLGSAMFTMLPPAICASRFAATHATTPLSRLVRQRRRRSPLIDKHRKADDTEHET